MSQTFSRTNPLSLAVLTVLWNEPMHPYRMMQTLERQRKNDEVGFTIGSLYNVVDSLTKCGLIVAVGTERTGQRPPRTVYAVTDSGIAEATAWVRELLAHPVAEYPKFMVGLSLLPYLPPDEAADLLRTRTRRLESMVDAAETSVRESPVPEMLLIEKQYAAALAWPAPKSSSSAP